MECGIPHGVAKTICDAISKPAPAPTSQSQTHARSKSPVVADRPSNRPGGRPSSQSPAHSSTKPGGRPSPQSPARSSTKPISPISPTRGPRTIKEWWSGHGFPASEFGRFEQVGFNVRCAPRIYLTPSPPLDFVQVGVELLSDLQFVELTDLLDAGISPALARNIVQATQHVTSSGSSRQSSPSSSPQAKGKPSTLTTSPQPRPDLDFAPDRLTDDLWTVLRKWCKVYDVPQEQFLGVLSSLGVESYSDLLLVEPADLVAEGFSDRQARSIISRLLSTPLFNGRATQAQ